MKHLPRAALFLALLLLFGCTGTMETSLPLLGGDGEDFSISMTAGDPISLALSLPSLEKDAPTLTIDAKSPLSAKVLGNDFQLSCNTPGSYPLRLTLEAKGYEPLTVNYQVEVSARPMALDLLDAEGNDVSALSLVRGESVALTIRSESGAAISVADASSSSYTAVLEGEILTITANHAQDNSSITLHATLAGYADATLTLPVSVTAVPTALSIPTAALSGLVGDTLSLSCDIDPQGRLSVACDPALQAIINGKTISFKAAQPGVYQVDLTAEAPGDLPSTKSVSVTFSEPVIPLTAPSAVILAVGESTTVFVSAPLGSSVWTKASDGFSASIDPDGMLRIDAMQAGNGIVTVGASKEGFSDSSIAIAVTASILLPTASSTYADEMQQTVTLVNQERAAQGLPPLARRKNLDGLAQLRAQEAAQSWSHTRPDGRGFETTFTDYGLHFAGEGENLFASTELDAELAMQEWMNSPSHRANILRSNFDSIAVGVVKGQDGEYYFCQHFFTD